MRRFLSVLLCSATVAMMPAAASVTPGSGVSGTVLSKGTLTRTLEDCSVQTISPSQSMSNLSASSNASVRVPGSDESSSLVKVNVLG